LITDVTRGDFYDLEGVERDVFGEDGFNVYLLEQYYRNKILYQKLIDDESRKVIGFYIVSPLEIDDLSEELKGIIDSHVGIAKKKDPYIKIAHLVNFVVVREYWKHGYGTQMIQQVLREIKIRKYKRILLEVNDINESAISLYLKNDFAIIGRVKGYYGSGASCDVMMCDIKK
jgi:ribosomal protein S18 acetylase RimI-like enzyme